MNVHGTPVLCYTRDTGIADFMSKLATPDMVLQIVTDTESLYRQANQFDPAVIILDLRTAVGGQNVGEIAAKLETHLLIALGIPRSDPMLAAAALPLYAVESLPPNPDAFRRLLAQAREHVELQAENKVLRRLQAQAEIERQHHAATASETKDAPIPMRELFRILRCLDDLDRMLDQLVEEVAGSLHFTRAGIVIRETSDGDYRLRTGWLLLEDTGSLRFPADHPFIVWLKRHAHLVDGACIERLQNPAESVMVKRMLTRLGAEVIVPLCARGGLFGWLFVGHDVTGNPLDRRRLEGLAAVGNLISASLESALLYREITIRKKMAESLLHALPNGIIFVAEEGRIQWFNTVATDILGISIDDVRLQPVEILGPRLTDFARRMLNDDVCEQPLEWSDPVTQRPLQVSAHRIAGNNGCLGVLLIVTDLTDQKAFKEKQDRLDRATFWNDLSASMSHEIRNPLVAIKTFAQLLPERYQDPEFRDEFSRMVDQEVNRLNGIVDQINGFANFREISTVPTDLRLLLRKALARVLDALDPEKTVKVEQAISEKVPDVMADETAIQECFIHLLTNAVESIQRHPDPVLRLRMETVSNGASDRFVLIQISDNGDGIPPAVLQKVFSPFCTTKARGMGLGLPIAQRTVADHNGTLKLDTDKRGTSVTVMLPAASNTQSLS